MKIRRESVLFVIVIKEILFDYLLFSVVDVVVAVTVVVVVSDFASVAAAVDDATLVCCCCVCCSCLSAEGMAFISLIWTMPLALSGIRIEYCTWEIFITNNISPQLVLGCLRHSGVR